MGWSRLIFPSTSLSVSPPNSEQPLPDRPSLSACSITGRFRVAILWTNPRNPDRSSWKRINVKDSRKECPRSTTSSTNCKKEKEEKDESEIARLCHFPRRDLSLSLSQYIDWNGLSLDNTPTSSFGSNRVFGLVSVFSNLATKSFFVSIPLMLSF